MMNFFSKLKFLWTPPFLHPKPKIVVIDDNYETTKRIISQILGRSFRVEREVLFVDNIEKVDLLQKGYLILNFDDNSIQRFKEKTSAVSLAKVLTFGFQEGADFQATDLKQNDSTNFKINHQGNIVPIWLKGIFSQREIYSVLAAAAVGTIFDLNLVEISQALTSVTK